MGAIRANGSELDGHSAADGRQMHFPVPALPAKIQVLSIDSLLPARSPRLGGEDIEHIRALAELRMSLPPIIVHHPSLRIIDGAHRVAAARLRGEKTIRAVLFNGDERAAFALAVRANIAHGLPLSYGDRVAAAAEIIRNYPDWSDRSVAATTGLSAATVKSVRERSRLPAQAAAKRLGLDGRMRPVNSGAGRKRVQELIEKFPTASLRQLAREAGVSPNTVRDVRRRMQQQETAAPEPARTAAAQAHAAPAENVNGSPVEAALRRLSQDPSLRLTESGRLAIRWFFSRIVRPREWIGIIGSLPPHTAFILAGLADQCAAEWQSLARSLRDQEHRSRPDQR